MTGLREVSSEVSPHGALLVASIFSQIIQSHFSLFRTLASAPQLSFVPTCDRQNRGSRLILATAIDNCM